MLGKNQFCLLRGHGIFLAIGSRLPQRFLGFFDNPFFSFHFLRHAKMLSSHRPELGKKCTYGEGHLAQCFAIVPGFHFFLLLFVLLSHRPQPCTVSGVRIKNRLCRFLLRLDLRTCNVEWFLVSH
ncbi:MAG: hypothetical protein CMJ52_08285 [Planctomycetaceae bacterium]|nr:hypothetical protein [Planctomycetaceae bacterium]